MKHHIQRIVFLTALVSSPVYILGNSYEEPPYFTASEILPPEVLEGPHHKVGDSVAVVRYGYQFELETETDRQVVWSKSLLQRRIQEAEAIAKLSEISQTKAFITSLRVAAEDPLMAAWSVAKRPVATIKELPSGATRYFKGKFYWVKKSSEEVSEKTMEVAAKAKDIGTGESEFIPATEELSKEATEAAYNASKRHLGFNKAKREWAKRMKVDPYSDNQELQLALERIAWATSLGSFAADTVIPSYSALDYAADLNNAVWETAPIELEQQNDERLKAANIEGEVILAFHDHDQFKISEKTAISMVVEKLDGVGGLSDFLKTILGAGDQTETSMMIKVAAILGRYHEAIIPLARIEIRRGMITAIDDTGKFILPVAVDHLYWTQTAREVAGDPIFDHPEKEVWVSGRVSRVTFKRLRELNWVCREKCFGMFETVQAK
jgi:hypothetical protein